MLPDYLAYHLCWPSEIKDIGWVEEGEGNAEFSFEHMELEVFVGC